MPPEYFDFIMRTRVYRAPPPELLIMLRDALCLEVEGKVRKLRNKNKGRK